MAIASVKATINGTEYTLTYNSSTQKYEATITAPAQTSGSNNSGQGPGVGGNASGKGYYPVTIVATDDAGNVSSVNDQTAGTLGTACRLKVLEKVNPTASVTYPTANATITSNKPTFTASFGDSGSGIKTATAMIKIDSGSWVAMTASGSGASYTGSYTPATALVDGNHTAQVKVEDWDGNSVTGTAITFKIDTTPPVLNVTSPVNNLVTNQASCVVAGTTNDAISSPVTVTVKLNSGTAQPVTVQANGSFSTTVTLAEGSNTIVVVATDSAGKASTVTRTVSLNTSAPVISAITIAPNPADTGASYVITVTVSD